MAEAERFHDESRIDDAWAAGLFEGEGSITFSGTTPRLQLKMTDAQPVTRFCDVLGGKVYGPYTNRAGERDGYPRQDFYLWVAVRETATQAFERMRPWLSEYRLARYAEVFGG